MRRSTMPLHVLTAMHPGNPHGLRFAEGDGGDKGGGGNGDGGDGGKPDDKGGEQEKQAPWEKNGEEFDAEKAKTYINSLTAERDREAKARKDAEAKVKEHDDAQLSETEKLTADRDSNKALADQRGRTVDQYEVAAEVGLPLSWAKRLVGDDRDALLADAKAMKADLDEKSKGGNPRPDPSQGGSGGSGKADTVAAAKDDYLASRSKKKQ